MLGTLVHFGLSLFWSPNFERNFPNPAEEWPELHAEPHHKGRNKGGGGNKNVRCKVMQALQRALSEAQKVGLGVEVLKELIKTHKSTCSSCRCIKK
jgi:hypothetical protein